MSEFLEQFKLEENFAQEIVRQRKFVLFIVVSRGESVQFGFFKTEPIGIHRRVEVASKLCSSGRIFAKIGLDFYQ